MQPKESKSSRHFYISLIKSGVRILAGGYLVFGNMIAAGTALIVAEILGIVEEL